MSDEQNLTPPLDPCGCCDGISVDTPAQIDNPPGLPAVRYRVGTHATFKSSMLARLATAELEPDPLARAPIVPAAPAPDLRSSDDFAAALIDSFAVVADVLTFYQERIANESYLGTATERRSILELAREIGYEPAPGVAAAAALKLITEEPPQLPPNVAVPAAALAPVVRDVPVAAGTKVQSVPGPGEKPQTFETIEDIVAYPEWNEIRPRLTTPVYAPTKVLWSAGRIDAKAGETIVIHAKNNAIATITSVEYHADLDFTEIEFAFVVRKPTALLLTINPGLDLEQLTATKRTLGDAAVKASLESKPWTTADLRLIARLQGWALDDLAEAMRRYGLAFIKSEVAFSTFSIKAASFGANAPAFDFAEDTSTDPPSPFKPIASEFKNITTLADVNNGVKGRVYLDGVYKDLASDSVAVFWRAAVGTTSEQRKILMVNRVDEMVRTSLSINAKVTTIEVTPPEYLKKFHVRNTVILAGSRRFDASIAPNEDVIEDDELELDGVFVRLYVGQKLIISGERDDAPGLFVSEVRAILEVQVTGAYTYVTLDRALDWKYIRRSVTITANVASATHGETVEEVLGSGNAGTAYQSFTLRRTPLTYITAQTASGIASTLEVQVNDVIWSEVPSLYGHGPQERIYVTRHADDGMVTVQFGDGITGARLPTGLANVRTKYRVGIGLEGLVGADKIMLLLSRPLGLKGASNPLPSADAADPESREEARRNAPITVLTLDRVVSLRDFEDFARARTGIAKTLASWMLGAERRGVFVTVAGQNGNAITDTGAIENALHAFGNKFVPVRVRSYRELLFRIQATVKVAPDRIPDVVRDAIDATLRDAFSFEKRSFGQPVHRSEVIALIQNVPGVVSVNLTSLKTTSQTTSPLTAEVPEGDLSKAELGAQLLLLDPRPIALEVTR